MPLCTLRFAVATLFTTLMAGAALAADRSGAAADAAADRLAHEVFGQLIGINTTDSAGNVTTAAEAMAQRFLAAGFPAADVVDPNDDRAHGRDERIGVASFYQANEFFYRYLRRLTAS